MSCAPSWYQDGLTCPYGQRLPLQVTLPSDAGGWQYISVVYGYSPWFVCLGIAALFIVFRGSKEFATGAVAALTLAINELLKQGFKQSRPVGSCLSTCGMPSSHSAIATALLLYFVLDAAYRVRPPREKVTRFLPSIASIIQSLSSMVRGIMLLPSMSISQGEFAAHLCIWTLVLLPVPVSRVMLNDHSPSQVMAGMFVGCVAVCVWYPLMLLFRLRFRDHVGQKYFYIFIHNYDVPEGWKTEKDNDDHDTESTREPLVVGEPTSPPTTSSISIV